jgi:CTP-dependent riboflavin kinase
MCFENTVTFGGPCDRCSAAAKPPRVSRTFRFPTLRRLHASIVDGVGHFRQRMTKFPQVFERVTGQRLFPGTLNLDVGEPVTAREHFRLFGREIDEPGQDLLFEIVRVNGIWGYRIRPYDLRTGGGGHGDHILEIASADELRPTLSRARVIEVELFR